MNYKVNRTNRKSISIKIVDENNILISAPKSVSNDKIKEFVLSKQDWILKHVSRLADYKNNYSSVLSHQKYCIFGSVCDYSGNFKTYYQNLAKNYLTSRLIELANYYNFTFNKLTFKNLISKWGSCDNNKNIVLNCKLVFLDKRVIDYVLVHELCHTVHLNHKRNFHNILSSKFPDEKEIKKLLKESSVLIKLKYWI